MLISSLFATGLLVFAPLRFQETEVKISEPSPVISTVSLPSPATSPTHSISPSVIQQTITETRSSAENLIKNVPQPRYGIPENADGKWLYVNTTLESPYPSTRWDSNVFTIPANTDVKLESAVLPFRVGTHGVLVALVCAQQSCPKPIGEAGTVGPDGFITYLSFAQDAQLSNYQTKSVSLNFNSSFNAKVRIFAVNGTEAFIDHANVSQNGTQLVQNGDFRESVTRALSRNVPTKVNNLGISFVPDDTNGYQGFAIVKQLGNDARGSLVARSFNSARYFHMPHYPNNLNDVLRYRYTFRPLQTGGYTYKLVYRAKIAKKSSFSPNTINVVGSACEGTTECSVFIENCQIPQVNSEFAEYSCDLHLTGTGRPRLATISFVQSPGVEIMFDWIKVTTPTSQVLPESLIDTFPTQTVMMSVKQPSNWTNGANNYNDYMSRWSAKESY